MQVLFSSRGRTAILFCLSVILPLTLSSHSAHSAASIQPDDLPPGTSNRPAVTQPVVSGTDHVSGLKYTVKSGENTRTVARKFLSQSSLMRVSELDAAIREANHITNENPFKPGTEITIPTLEPQPVVETSRRSSKDADIRAIYLTGNSAGSVFGLDLVSRWQKLGGNAVVFDIKDSDGSLSVAFEHPLAPRRKPPISNLPKYVRYLHSLNMHVIARIALFRDDHIAQHHAGLAIHSRATGQPWLENGKLVWTDPSNSQVQQYNLALAKFAAQSGVDEVQFDYVRFPAEGNQTDARFLFESAGSEKKSKTARSAVITAFLKQAYEELHTTGTLLSLDVFGIMAWQRPVDLSHTGQDIAAMSKYCDVLSPMIYPSHFYGMGGYALPGDAPEHFISTSMERFRKITGDSGPVLRPWLQAFGWRTKTYSPEYIKLQVITAKQKGGIGFLLWNARNDYSRPFAAMPEMTAAKERYFGKAATQLASKPIPGNAPPAEKTIALNAR